MAIRKSVEREFNFEGNREAWLETIEKNLIGTDFSNVDTNETLFTIKADHRRFTCRGTLQVTLISENGNTRIVATATANVDNIYALFQSPGQKILDKFEDCVG